MPGGNQRNLQIPRQPRAQNARFARPGDVDNIRAECPQTLFQEFLVAQEGRIEGEIFFQTERNRAAAGNLERSQLALLLLAYRAIPLARDGDKKKAAPCVAQRLQNAGWYGPPR